MKRKKERWVAVLDFDGTMTDSSDGTVFQMIENHAGLPKEAVRALRENNERFAQKDRDGTLTMKEEIDWIFQEVRTYISNGLTNMASRGALVNQRMRPGLREALEWCRAEGIPVAIVSYGIRQFIEIVLEQHGLSDLVDRIYALNLTADPSTGRYVGMINNTTVIPSNKKMMSCDFAREHSVSYARIFAIGDSLGDRELGYERENRFGFASNPGKANIMDSHFGKVVITDRFDPALSWMKDKRYGKK